MQGHDGLVKRSMLSSTHCNFCLQVLLSSPMLASLMEEPSGELLPLLHEYCISGRLLWLQFVVGTLSLISSQTPRWFIVNNDQMSIMCYIEWTCPCTKLIGGFQVWRAQTQMLIRCTPLLCPCIVINLLCHPCTITASDLQQTSAQGTVHA